MSKEADYMPKEVDALVVSRKRRLPESAGRRVEMSDVELSEGAEEDAMQPLQDGGGGGGGGGRGHAPMGHAPRLFSSGSAERVRLLGEEEEALLAPKRTFQGPKRKQSQGYVGSVGGSVGWRREYKCSVCLKPKKLECTCKASESSWAKSTWPQDRNPGLGDGGGGGRLGKGGRCRRVEQVCVVSRTVVQEHVSMTAAAGYVAVAKSTMYNAILQGHVLAGCTWRYCSQGNHELRRETQATAGEHLSRHSSIRGATDSYQTTAASSSTAVSSPAGETHSSVGQTVSSSTGMYPPPQARRTHAVSSSTGKTHSSAGQTARAPAKYGKIPLQHSLCCTHFTTITLLHSLYYTHITTFTLLHSLYYTHFTTLPLLHSLYGEIRQSSSEIRRNTAGAAQTTSMASRRERRRRRRRKTKRRRRRRRAFLKSTHSATKSRVLSSCVASA